MHATHEKLITEIHRTTRRTAQQVRKLENDIALLERPPQLPWDSVPVSWEMLQAMKGLADQWDETAGDSTSGDHRAARRCARELRERVLDLILTTKKADTPA